MVITISREYGAGGHSIGRSVAKELGIEFYDRDIIKQSAAEAGMNPQDLEMIEEEVTRTDRLLRLISPAAYIDQQDYITDIERHVILELAKKGPCVILGRCADDIMEKENMDSLDVFLYASDIHRAVRVSELIGSRNPSEIQKKMQKTDAARRTFYQHYTGKHWGDSKNYSISLDTGLLGYETCVKLICDAARSMADFSK